MRSLRPPYCHPFRIPARLNPAYAPYREWPESGLSKFKDIMAALRDHIAHADYFFFLDADVRFMSRVELVDIGADLTGVEHPMCVVLW